MREFADDKDEFLDFPGVYSSLLGVEEIARLQERLTYCELVVAEALDIYDLVTGDVPVEPGQLWDRLMRVFNALDGNTPT